MLINMKVSHELPLSLINRSYEWNDYDYCLPHLLDKYSTYKEFFYKARDNNRFIIMDNGLFEGVKHTTKDLLEKINLIQPNIFIVPDAWNDSIDTLVKAKSWILNYKKELPEKTQLMAVCQGNNMGELVSTYQTLLDLGYTHIAFNHSSIAYTNEFPHYEKLKAQMYGRMEFIRRLVETDTIDRSVYHHLLGCSLPQEILVYGNWKFIKSIDTSNPIIAGYKGFLYGDNGIHVKPTEKIEDLFNKNLENNLKDIIFNIQKFKSFLK